jgi:hypothetical protein
MACFDLTGVGWGWLGVGVKPANGQGLCMYVSHRRYLGQRTGTWGYGWGGFGPNAHLSDRDGARAWQVSRALVI